MGGRQGLGGRAQWRKWSHERWWCVGTRSECFSAVFNEFVCPACRAVTRLRGPSDAALSTNWELLSRTLSRGITGHHKG